MAAFKYFACFAGLAVALITAVSVRAAQLPPSGPFPDAICDEDARMNIFISRDGTIWECVCEKLQDGTACDWFEQGNVNQARLAKRIKTRLHVRVLPRMRVLVVA